MAMVPKFCRMAWIVDDMAAFERELSELLGAKFVTPTLIAELYPDAGFKVMFGEHGIEPIQPGPEGIGFAKNGKLIEIAVDVDDAEAVRAKVVGAGYSLAADSYLPVPDAHEYLFGWDFCGVPMLACTVGDNEAQMRAQGPFDALDDAAPPKIGFVTAVVEDADAVAATLNKFFKMEFVETDPAGLGRRALTGTHRVKLIEGPSALLDGIERPLAAIEMIVGDVEGTRTRFEAAGYGVRHSRPLRSGGTAYYFGPTVQGLPISIYPQAADAEMLGVETQAALA